MSQEYTSILLDHGAVATITLNRPEARNALNSAMWAELVHSLRALDADPGVRVIVLKGAGKGFCAGADLGKFEGRGILAAREEFVTGAENFKTIANIGKFVIAQVHGFALAGGLGLAVACDITYGAEDAVFGTPEANVGLWPFMISAPILRAVGRKRGLELMATGARIDGREAERCGLITRAFAADQLEEKVRGVANSLAAKSSVALRLGKQAFYTMADMEYSKALHYAREMITILSQTEDGNEGPRSFMEKRTPVWKGR